MASYHLFMLVLPAIVLVCPNCVSSLKDCQKGSYEVPLENDRPICLLCPEGTFMPYHDHRYKQCFSCTEIVNPSLEVLISPCNDTKDAVIHCIPGYYRRLGRNPREKARCEKCTECDHPIVPCRNYEDTHCCQGDHYIVYPDGNGEALCWETYWLCRRGHYYDSDSSLCELCPTGTFMSLDYHSMTECWPCQTPSELHHLPKDATIIQECNSTHPPRIGCKDGFYTDHETGNNEDDIGCSPCTVCNSTDRIYEGRACDRFHNTVCCPLPEMIVVDTPEGMKCEADDRSLLSTQTDFNDSQMDEMSTASSISASVTTMDTHGTSDGFGGKCRCKSPSCQSVNGATVAVIVFAVIFLAIVAVFCVFLFCRKWRSKITRCYYYIFPRAEQHGQDLDEATQLLLTTTDNQETVSEESLPEEIKAHVKGFKLSESDYKRVMELLNEEMDKGLNRESHQRADVKMFPTFVRSMPDRSVSGKYIAMQWDSIKIRLLYMHLENGDMEITWKKPDMISETIKSGNKSQLFKFIGGCVEEFISQLNMTDTEIVLGWSVSFPCCHTSLESARLTRVTKECHCNDVVGEDVSQLLNEELTRRGCKVKTVAVVNNAVGVLLSVAHGDPDCHIGMVMGRGFNICYMEDIDNVEMMYVNNTESLQPRQVIINTELGALGDNGCLDVITTEYDCKVDENSTFCGQQRMEKMVSGTYLGEIVRRVLVKLIQNKLLFKRLHRDLPFYEKGSFTFKYIQEIESDPDGVYKCIKRVLDDMKIEYHTVTDEDCRIIRYVCSRVSERAAFFAAAALATVINRMNKPEVTIAVDGSLYKLHPQIQHLMHQMITKLVKPNIQFKLQEAEGGCTVGAALAAAMAVRLSNTAPQ